MDHPEIVDFIQLEGARGEEGPRPHRRRASRATSTARPTARSAARTRNNSVRVTDDFMKAVAGGRHVADHQPHHRRGRATRYEAQRPLDQDRRGAPGAAPIRACSSTRPSTRWHTCPNIGTHQRVEPVLRVHVPRRHGLQPGVAQPDQVPARGRQRSTSTATATRARVLHGAGDPGRFLELPDRARSRRTRHDYRPLGLGYANLGTLLMLLGVPYDRDEGRAIAAALTAIMTGQAYARVGRDRGAARAPSPASRRTASRCCA